MNLSPELLRTAAADPDMAPVVRALHQRLTHPLESFRPRPDNIPQFDQQTGFVKSASKFSIVLGGVGCLGGEEKLYNPVTKESVPISEIADNFHVVSMGTDGFIKCGMARKPWIKGIDQLYRIHLSNGESFVATLDHKLALPRPGLYIPIRDILTLESAGHRIELMGMGEPVTLEKVEFERDGEVWDTHVEEWNNYNLAGIWHHNSGKTDAAAYKTAHYVLDNKPPRYGCPFWIVGDSMEQVGAVCWDEKLDHFIPKERILRKLWYKEARNWPRAVQLKHPDNPKRVGWVLEFKSYKQGLTEFKSRSIGGYWFNEEVPLPIVQQVQGRCRDYDSPGWADFTPIQVVSPEWPEKYNEPPRGWKFFHLNTALNHYIDQEWYSRFIESIPEDERETYSTGHFAGRQGAVFKEFRRAIHVIEPFVIPAGWYRIRGLDFGFNNPTAMLWVAQGPDDIWYVYGEYYASGKLNTEHAAAMHEAFYWDEQNRRCGPTFSDHDAQQRYEYQKLGIRCVPANKSDKLRNIRLLRQMMMKGKNEKARLYIFNTCKNTIREIQGYHWAPGTGTGLRERNASELPVDMDDHCCDALEYALGSHVYGVGSAPTAGKREWKPREGIQLDMRHKPLRLR